MHVHSRPGRRPSRQHVHTIDVWFSTLTQTWLVLRLNADGAQIGAAHRAATRDDAEHCARDWLRQHPEAQLVRDISGLGG